MLKKLLPPLPQVGYLPYFLLSYLLIFFSLLKPLTLWSTVAAAAIVLVFLYFYFHSFNTVPKRLWLDALVICALGVLGTPLSPGASVFFTYSACCGAGFERPKPGLLLIALNLLVAGATTLVGELPMSYWLPALGFPIVVGLPTVYMGVLGRQRAQLLRKQEEVEQLAKIAERERISRDMHDVLGHSLSVIALKAELARKLISRDRERAEREMADVETSARDLLTQLREAVAGYRSAGLVHELNAAKTALTSADIVWDCASNVPVLPAEIENVIALCVREGITNILRHSGASSCGFSLALDANAVHCRLHDNGVKPGGGQVPGNGLRGMRERIEALGGALQIEADSDDHSGWVLAWSLPLIAQKKEQA